MPQFIVPIIMAASAATSAGLGIYSAVNQPGAPQQTQQSPADITKQAISAETSSREAATKAAGQLLPGLQYNTSGGLSPDAYATLSSDFSGSPGLANSPQMKALIAQFMGTDTGFGGNSAFGSGSTPSNPISPGLT